MRISSPLTAACCLLASALDANAQLSRASQPPTLPIAPIGCTAPADTSSLRVTLAPAVLDHLEGISNSVFVHAYLIRLISAEGAGSHPLSECARNFVAAELHELPSLRENLPDATAIIDALRATAEAEARAVQLSASPQVGQLVQLLLGDQSPEAVTAATTPLRAALGSFCPDAGGPPACRALRDALSQIAALQTARSRASAAAARVRQAAEALQSVESDLAAAVSALATDSASLRTLMGTNPDAASPVITELNAAIDEWERQVEELTSARTQALDAHTAASNEHQREESAARTAEPQLAQAVDRLSAALLQAPANDKLTQSRVVPLEGVLTEAPRAEITIPPAQATTGNPAARSANLLLELTDFIIARARREAVNTFIINLHGLARREELLAVGFPETFGLMNGISVRSDSVLNAVEVGRIPLTVWRATLAGDFVRLPVNLVKAGPSVICGGGGRKSGVAASGCEQNAAVLLPLVPAAQRLLGGEGVLDILRDASSFSPPAGPDLPSGWNRVSQALSMVGALADTYLAQGFVPAADPVRHPYILTARSLVQVPQTQRDALLRLLLVRAIPPTAEVPDKVDGHRLQTALAGATRLFERIVATQRDTLSTSQVIHTAFEALGATVAFARPLLPDTLLPAYANLEQRWMQVSAAIEPLVSRNFGLALSRTVILLRELRGNNVPESILRFASLASALSEAQTGEQIRAAFDAAASPVGGWQAKRYGEGGVGITAFPGAAGGFEQVIREHDDPEDVADAGFAIGASLPIGLELTMPRRNRTGELSRSCVLCATGFFFPLVDLGALLSYRVAGPGSVASEPNASVRQVFAPGIYLTLAFTRSWPITMLVGGQLMPSLRSVETTEGLVNRSAVRYGVSIGMDIRLFDF